ncbi:MAG: ABC transporter permease [Lachnospiraceae bacterium]|uniref:ABC transporter permease n=1 Tax=Clostridium sp. (strain SY8519) TaxID=1042156 RepID=UPI00021720F8|nr:ABC transporter permease [Clostridium sp. SY8519]MCI1654675.1 ABC transporter permease [Lachnospiraceae bacterium]MCI1657060.1 ABC transporter permease [Lachnospiraceae bacterium]MCI2195515.1 ABC transporter permease [Lachnospiraceae bacterium]BAK47931.1 hypothetical protein CXIVA_19640 [Clostridium sp. SY8519]
MIVGALFQNLSLLSLLSSLPGAFAQGLIWGIVGLGVYISYKVLDIPDLTVDGSLATGGAVAVMCILHGCPPAVSLVIAFISGLAAGLLTGFFHTTLGIPDILAGILSQIALYSINLNIMGRSNQAVSVDMYRLVVSLRHIPHALVVSILFIIVIMILVYCFMGTEFGCALRSTGCNKNMSRAQGVNTNVAILVGLMLSNGLVGLAGGLLAQYQGNADVNMGRGAIVIGLAAVIIGLVLGEAIFGKRLNFIGKMAFVVIGAVIYYLVITVVLWLGLPSNDMKLFSAIIVAVFLAVPYLSGKKKASFKKAGKNKC